MDFLYKCLGYQRNSRAHEPCIQIVRGQLARPNGFFAQQSPPRIIQGKLSRDHQRPIFLGVTLNCFAFKILILMFSKFCFYYSSLAFSRDFFFLPFLQFFFGLAWSEKNSCAHTTSRKQFAVFTHILSLIQHTADKQEHLEKPKPKTRPAKTKSKFRFTFMRRTQYSMCFYIQQQLLFAFSCYIDTHVSIWYVAIYW